MKEQCMGDTYMGLLKCCMVHDRGYLGFAHSSVSNYLDSTFPINSGDFLFFLFIYFF